MGRIRNAALAACCLLLLAGAASAAGTATDLRRDEPLVDQMVAAAPSSALFGRLNRVAALLDSAPVRDLPAGSSAALPASFERDLVRALDALGDEAMEALPAFDSGEALVLLYAIDRVAFRRTAELYDDAAWTYCEPEADNCSSPAALWALDRLGYRLADAFYAVADGYGDACADNPLLPAFEVTVPEGYNSHTFSAAVDEALGQCGRALGVESIDD